MPPTSPPCGIAYLKAFVKTGKTFDLNLKYYETAVAMVDKGTIPVEAEIEGYVLEPETLKKAVTFFKKESFYNQEEYNTHTTIFTNYFIKIDEYIKEECMKYLFIDNASDEALTFFDQLLAPVTHYHPDLVGFSQMILLQREFVLGLAKHLKAQDIPLVIGGASLSYNAECYLSEIGAHTKTDLSNLFDAAIYGEGELPLKLYIEGEPLENIPNIVYKTKKKIIRTKESGLKDLDTLSAPNFEDFSLKDYYSPEIVLPLLTSKGCYWMRCTFCTHYKSYYKWRTRSIEKVIEDVKELQKKYNANYFLFADEMIHPQFFNKLSDTILKEGLTIRYYTEVKPTKDFTSELLQKMYLSGVRALLWGVESGTQRVLDLIDKGTTVPAVEKVLKDSHTTGIWNMIFMIIGYPTQTEKEIKKDIEFLYRNRPYIATLGRGLFTLQIGSRIYENPEQFGIEKIEKNLDPFSTLCQYKVVEGLSREEASSIYQKHITEYRNIYRISQYFGKMRDHMLLFADHTSGDPLCG
jgi:radical SAM superfamily enzyme YgiQ (UPF0313 family)